MRKTLNRRRNLPLLLHLLLFLLGQIGGPSLSHALDASAVAEHAAEGVVLVTGYMGQDGDEPYVIASGYLIDDGFVVSVNNVFTAPSNRHVCERFVIRFLGGREMRAKAYSMDPILNLILLKLAEPLPKPPESATSNRVRPGDTVIALAGGGSPHSVPYTIGSVKARHKTSVYGAGLGDMFIDSRMRLPPNGDGGPLLNEGGEVIGINTPNIHRPDTVQGDPEEAHALPIRVVSGFFKISKAFPTSEQLWMGLAFRPLSPEEKKRTYHTLGQSGGVLIDYVWSDGPAGESDIAQGDVLVSVNGAKVEHLHELERMLAALRPNNLVQLAILRARKGLIRQVVLERRPAWAGYVNWRFPEADASVSEGR